MRKVFNYPRKVFNYPRKVYLLMRVMANHIDHHCQPKLDWGYSVQGELV